MTVTAKTLTGTEIHEVYSGAIGLGSRHDADPDLIRVCTVARNAHGDFTDDAQATACITVAAAINARKAGSK
jgi:hypothetical protein